MYLEEFFKNYASFELEPGDIVYYLDERNTDFYYIKRASEKAVGGIFHAATGKLVAKDREFDDAFIFGYDIYDTRNFLCVSKDGMVGAYSTEDGRQMIPIKFKEISKYAVNLIWVKGMDGKCGLYTDTGEEVLPVKYRSIAREIYQKKFIKATGKDGVSIVSKNGDVLLRDAKDCTINFYKEFYTIQYKDYFGFYSLDGTIYEGKGQFKYLRGNLFEVTVEAQKCVITLDGTIVVPMGDYAGFHKSGEFIVVKKNDGSIERIFIE